jgi:hypothetical protein
MSIIQHHIKIHSVYKYRSTFIPVSGISEAVNLAMQTRMKSEIIGNWLYCFTSELKGIQLLAIGFWYSKKHLAYVYSGNPKDGIADDESLDEIRARLGSQPIRK